MKKGLKVPPAAENNIVMPRKHSKQIMEIKVQFKLESLCDMESLFSVKDGIFGCVYFENLKISQGNVGKLKQLDINNQAV